MSAADRELERALLNLLMKDVKVLRQRKRRLSSLIKTAEWNSEAQGGDPACPWCPALRVDGRHADTCPAFTPDGEVR